MLEERTRLYEIMIRFDAQGAPSAIQRHIHEVVRDGEVIAASERPAAPLDPAAVEGLIGRHAAALLAENLRLKALLTPEQRRVLDSALG
jgi:hypothetical protein